MELQAQLVFRAQLEQWVKLALEPQAQPEQ